jgi:hypothetical protein
MQALRLVAEADEVAAVDVAAADAVRVAQGSLLVPVVKRTPNRNPAVSKAVAVGKPVARKLVGRKSVAVGKPVAPNPGSAPTKAPKDGAGKAVEDADAAARRQLQRRSPHGAPRAKRCGSGDCRSR